MKDSATSTIGKKWGLINFSYSFQSFETLKYIC